MPPKKRKIPRPVFFETTIPVYKPCRRCAVWFAAGVAEGMHVQVEFVVLDPGQAFMAGLAGLRLFALTRSGLIHLDESRLRDPAFSARFPEHRCGTVWERRIQGADTRPAALRPDEVPY